MRFVRPNAVECDFYGARAVSTADVQFLGRRPNCWAGTSATECEFYDGMRFLWPNAISAAECEFSEGTDSLNRRMRFIPTQSDHDFCCSGMQFLQRKSISLSSLMAREFCDGLRLLRPNHATSATECNDSWDRMRFQPRNTISATACDLGDGVRFLRRKWGITAATENAPSDGIWFLRSNANYPTECELYDGKSHTRDGLPFLRLNTIFRTESVFFSDEICHVSPTETIPATERMAFLQQNAISTPFFCDVRYVCPPTGCDFCAVFLRRGMYVCDVCLPTRDAISTRFCATPWCVPAHAETILLIFQLALTAERAVAHWYTHSGPPPPRVVPGKPLAVKRQPWSHYSVEGIPIENLRKNLRFLTWWRPPSLKKNDFEKVQPSYALPDVHCYQSSAT